MWSSITWKIIRGQVQMPKEKKRTGPAPERLKIEGDWMQAIENTLKRAKPTAGWPVPKAKKKTVRSKKSVKT
jgi:hypothetical protein